MKLEWAQVKVILGGILVVFLGTVGGLVVQAKTPSQMQGYRTTADGKAWTIQEEVVNNAGDPIQIVTNNYNTMMNARLDCWYPYDSVVNTGAKGIDKEHIKNWQHVYIYKRELGVNAISKWICKWERACCEHHRNAMKSAVLFHGISAEGSRCGKAYYSGWVPVCADCDEVIMNMYHYMKEDTVKQITALDTRMPYFYQCPRSDCRGLEQASEYRVHDCKGISTNRYRVYYHYDTSVVKGNLKPTLHMYNNDTVYNGSTAVGVQRKLNRVKGMEIGELGERSDALIWLGHEFVGWATSPDGEVVYQDGQEILNLTTENYDEKNPSIGTVHLYAVWKSSGVTLKIDPNGGKYENQAGIRNFTLGFQEQKTITKDKLIPPQGYTVSFRSNGGNAIADMNTIKKFSYWKANDNLKGTFVNQGSTGIYKANVSGNVTDSITAMYADGDLVLPTPRKANVMFCGWCTDEACTQVIGMGGDRYTPSKNTTLYAKWGELQLIATPNYADNGGKGAIDLKWNWNETQTVPQYYIPYQSLDKLPYQFQSVHSSIRGADKGESLGTRSYTKEGETKVVIPSSGYYEISLAGAQGGDFKNLENGEWFYGGKGATVNTRVYLKRGQTLTLFVGGKGNGQAGGTGGGGSASEKGSGGGGYSAFYVDGTLIALAGGGGGASISSGGGAGGTDNTSSKALLGQKSTEVNNGASGGGGGYFGGLAGRYEKKYHTHKPSCDFHKHSGNASTGGGCYGKANYGWKLCGTVRWVVRSCDVWWDAANNRCIRCWGTDPTARIHRDAFCNNVNCLFCEEASFGSGGWTEQLARDPSSSFPGNWFREEKDETRPSYAGKHYTWSLSSWSRNCGYAQEGYQCGLEGVVESYLSTSSTGGSSYVKEDDVASYSMQAGMQNGAGYAKIQTLLVGVVDDVLELKGIAAPDLAAPEAIAIDSILQKEEDGALSISFGTVEDKGTTYVDYVKAYTAKNNTFLADSNQSSPVTLTVGVKEYRYLINGTERQVLSALDGKGTTSTQIRVSGAEYNAIKAGQKKWLHIAAVDRNNNISETTNYLLGGQGVEKSVYTENLCIAAQTGTTPSNVLATGEGRTYYVKADGQTPFYLSFDAYVADMHQTYSLADLYQFRIGGPNATGVISLERATGIEFGYSESGDELLSCGANRRERVLQSGKGNIEQAFTMPNTLHGKRITVYPTAGCQIGNGKMQFSANEKDKAQKITLIGDSQAPILEGLEELEAWCQDYHHTGDLQLDLKVLDDLSGVENASIIIRNKEGMILLEASTKDVYHLVLSEQFRKDTGDFTITIEAIDKVGNRTEVEIQGGGYGIEASLQRVLPPHEPNFRAGESGWLFLTVSSKIDQVWVVFPEELSTRDASLNQWVSFPGNDSQKQKTILFQIPLGTADSDEYQVELYSYSGGVLLDSEPERCAFTVKGSVLEDLRTRLR